MGSISEYHKKRKLKNTIVSVQNFSCLFVYKFSCYHFCIVYLLLAIVGAQNFLRAIRAILTKRAKTNASFINKMQIDLTQCAG